MSDLKWKEEQLGLFVNKEEPTIVIPEEIPQPGTEDGQMRPLKKQDIGPIMIVWSKSANRKRLQDMRVKIKKTIKGWDGVLLHLLPGETVGSMKLPQVQALYEALMRSFDPDLYQIRMDKKAKAEKDRDDVIANEIADKLETIKKEQEFVSNFNTIQDTTKNIESPL